MVCAAFLYHYIVMTEPESSGYISVDNCSHKPVYPDHEWVCSLCGKVLSVEEVEEIQRGSAETAATTAYEDLGLDPHGKTPLWLHGLGTIEGYQHLQHLQQGEDRDDISILSNITDKLQLPSYAALEFLQLYRSFVKDRKRDRVCAAVLALFTLTARYSEIESRIRSIVMEDLASAPDQTDVGTGMATGTATTACVDYICMVVANNFGTSATTRNRIPIFRILYSRRGLLRRVARIARMKGAATALKSYSMEVI